MTTDETPVERWEITERELLQDCRVFRVERRRMSRGAAADDFYVIDSPDWVNVVALTDEDDLVLVEQWRHGVGEITLEIPGGMVDPEESPAGAAERELLEETGFRAREWFDLGHVEPNPAIQTNRCHTFLALGARREEVPRFDRNEHCRVVLRPWAQAGEMVASGEIAHALVVVGLHREALRRAGVLEAAPVEITGPGSRPGRSDRP